MKAKRDVRILLAVLGVLVVLIAVAGVLVMVLARQGGGPVELRLRLEAGRSYAFRTEVNASQKIEGRAGGQARSEMTMDYTWDVQEVDAEGNATIKVTQDAVRMESHGPGGEQVVYDSTSASGEEAGGIAAVFGALVGRSYTVKVSPTGDVLAVSGIGKAMAGMAEQVGGAGSQMGPALTGPGVGEEAVKASIQEHFDFYPPGPVRIGDSWERRAELPGFGETGMTTTYKLKKRRGGTAVIAVEAEIEGEAIEMPFGGGSIEISGTREGTLEVEESSGCVSKGEVTHEFAASMSGGAQSGKASGVVTQITRLMPK
jgi:hypothetical protein